MPKQRTSGFVLVSGYVLSGVAEANPQLEVSGSEIHSAGLNYAANRVKHAGLFQMNTRAIPRGRRHRYGSPAPFLVESTG